MPRYLLLFASFLLSTLSFASDVRVKVVDPQGAVVTGARVAAYPPGSTSAIAVAETAGDGIAQLTVNAERIAVRVLKAGFAPVESTFAPSDEVVVVHLAVASAAASVVVSAERTPLPTDESGATTSSLDAQAIASMQPVAISEALRFLPGAVISANGRRGGLGSLFVRGGDSRYNKVIVDGVTINDPGGTFDFAVVPMEQVDRLEFVRGAESTLYGSDAMTSVIQTWTRTGSTRAPELRFGAEGGTFETARGYASLAGARGRFDFNLFGDQFNTTGQGPNDDYSNSLQGANIGVVLAPRALFRIRARHSNNRSGVQSFWNFNGHPLLPPDLDQHARQNNFLASAELVLTGPSKLQHRITGFEYHHRRSVVDSVQESGRVSPAFGNFDFPFSDFANINRAGLNYQGEYDERSWARTTFGYEFEDENGWVGDMTALPLSHGLRRNHAVYGQQVLTWERVSLIGGVRLAHNETFGNKAVPRIAASVTALKGGQIFSGTRLRFSYATGIKEPRLEEAFGVGGFGIIPNPSLKAEENRSFETGVQQSFAGGKYFLGATYYNNLFTNQIAFSFDPVKFVSQYLNLNSALAHGAEIELRARPTSKLSVEASYTYTSTQILKAPLAFDPLLAEGAPLLRRPRHAGSLLVVYAARRWGGNVGGTFLSRRTDSDFLGLLPPVKYAAGYARFDIGTWRAITNRVTAYVNVENLLNRHYEEAAGYPALRANFRAGMRFRIGGE
jgi:outer membrane cobalamin receptor